MCKTIFYFMLFSFLFLKIYIVCDGNKPIVTLNDGSRLRGVFLNSRKGKQFSAYLGVPYAKPPIRELRFKNPVPIDKIDGIFEANNDSRICIQKLDLFLEDRIIGEEDCLYLNIYTPKIKSNDNKKYAVMVFIHGGGWIGGMGTREFYGPEYLLDHDIILVAPNYRVGPLGFLSTGDEHISGNFGLKDQQLALKWVQQNIEQFGGDSNSVTIFGESAGAASVQYHMFSKSSRGLFHGLISQSGSVFNSWAQLYKESGHDRTVKYAKVLNCPTSSSAEIITCLRDKNAFDLIAMSNFSYVFDIDPMIPFRPVVEADVEGAFLTDNPLSLLENNQVTDVPEIIGVTKDEGLFRSSVILSNPELLNKLDAKREEYFPYVFMYDESTDDYNPITKKIIQFYLGSGKIDVSKAEELTNLYTDALIFNGVEVYRRLRHTYLKSPLYHYHFTYRGTHCFTHILGNFSGYLGVSHADDLLYLFNIPLFKADKYNSQDLRMVDILTTLWTNFAKRRTPTTGFENLGFHWTPTKSFDQAETLFIKSPEDIQMYKNIFQERLNFWLNLNYNPLLINKLKQIRPKKTEL